MSAAEKAAQVLRYNTFKHIAVFVPNPEGAVIEIIQLSWWKMTRERIILSSMTIPNNIGSDVARQGSKAVSVHSASVVLAQAWDKTRVSWAP